MAPTLLDWAIFVYHWEPLTFLPKVCDHHCLESWCLPSFVAYAFDQSFNDTCFWNFDISNAPAYLFSTLNDIQTVNSSEFPYYLHGYLFLMTGLRVHVSPWSPVGSWLLIGYLSNIEAACVDERWRNTKRWFSSIEFGGCLWGTEFITWMLSS